MAMIPQNVTPLSNERKSMTAPHPLRTVVAVGIAGVLAGALAACSPAARQDAETNNGEAGELTSVTLQIDGAAVPYYAPLYEAVEQGFFEDHGLDVAFTYASGSDIVQNVAAGNVEFGFPNGDSVITAYANGIPSNVVHTTYQQGIGALLFDNSTDLSSPADLEGLRVGVTDLGSPNYAQLQAMLADAGLTVEDIEVETIGTGAIVQALQGGEVDAIVFSRLRYYTLQNAGMNVGQILSDQYLPSFGNILVTSPDMVESQPDTVAAFTAALDEGIQYAIDNIDDSVAMSIEQYAPSFEGQNDDIAQVLEEVFVAELWQSEDTVEHGFGYGDLERWQQAVDTQAEFGLIEEAFDADEMVVQPDEL